MPTVDIVRETKTSDSTRCRQLSAMFDVPMSERSRLAWTGDFPIEEIPEWNVGLIVGPSGCGKSTIAMDLFGGESEIKWGGDAVIDDFRSDISVKDITDTCQAVGFNTVPAWLRPYAVLSNGERFRVEMARRLLEAPSPIVVDEFTSVVDRQVAQIGAHAVQKYVRRHDKKFIAVTCHYDVIDWLQPDWVFEPGNMKFHVSRGSHRRPELHGEIRRVRYDMWQIFAPYHYLTASLNKAARCFVLFIDGRPAAFMGVLHRPNRNAHNIKGISRVVTLPDWQGLGLLFRLINTVGAAYKALGYRLRAYPAHPALIRNVDKSPEWKLCKKPGLTQKTGKGVESKDNPAKVCRPCAIFEYVGPAMTDKGEARQLIS